jgi:putative hemolysin
MPPLLLAAGAGVAAMGSLYFTTLTYALRELSRARLADYFDKAGGAERWLDVTLDNRDELILVTAFGRMISNTLLLVFVLLAFHGRGFELWQQYAIGVTIAIVVTLMCSVAMPHALAKYAGHTIVGQSARFLHVLRMVFSPVTKFMLLVEHVVKRATGSNGESEPAHIEQDILSAVEEGQKEGVVDEQEREMIESVISFRDTFAGQIMTARPEVVGISIGASLDEVKRMLEESGHSRLPVFRDTLDQIVGILYARDLLKHLGLSADQFDIRGAMRTPFYVPETKPLRDLLNDFRLQKVHLAVVLDEYGGTAGLVTIEDVLEELVGDISDEHEPTGPAMVRKVDDHTWEADARVYIDELNRVVGTSIPEDAGYDTLGGFISNAMGRIPERDATFEEGNVKYTILDAEPQKVNRVRIEFALQPAGEGPTGL